MLLEKVKNYIGKDRDIPQKDQTQSNSKDSRKNSPNYPNNINKSENVTLLDCLTFVDQRVTQN